MSESLQALLENSALGADQAAYLESLYEQFLTDPQSVDPKWRNYFSTVRKGVAKEVAHGPIRDAVALRAKDHRAFTFTANPSASNGVSDTMVAKQGAVSRLMQVYANRGHLVADLDPLGLWVRPEPDVMKLSYFGLSEADLDTEFHTSGPFNPGNNDRTMKLRDIIAGVKQVYCGNIGAEFAHVSDTTERLWLQQRFLDGRLHYRFNPEERKTILWQLTAAEGRESVDSEPFTTGWIE